MDAAKTMDALRCVDRQYLQRTAPDKLHPLSRLIVTLVFIVVVLSCPKYTASLLVPFAIYPVATAFLGEIPLSLILKRTSVCMPAVILLGIFNPILDKNRAVIGDFIISAGWFSFAVLFIKCALTVTAAFILVCSTGIDGISASLRILRVPKLIVAQLLFTYRYIHVLGDEAVTMISAYGLRAPRRAGRRDIGLKYFGSLAGGMFLRATRQAEAVYTAMLCRGFNGVMPNCIRKKISCYDILYIIAWISFFVLTRYYNLSLFLGNFLVG